VAVRGTAQVIKNIHSIFDRRKAATYALCLEYAAKAIEYFRQEQSGDRFWTNRTNQAKDRMFTDAFITNEFIGWLMAHGVWYGVTLELANDGLHESIRPVIMYFLPQFKKDLAQIWGHAVA
jgi:hypothetical protein